MNGRPPAEADIRRFFRVSGPAVHQVVLILEHAGLISRQSRTPRSIRVLVPPNRLPMLHPSHDQPVKISVQGYWFACPAAILFLHRLDCRHGASFAGNMTVVRGREK